jgi:hypothetical protein
VRKLTIKATLAELSESKLQAGVRLDIISRRYEEQHEMQHGACNITVCVRFGMVSDWMSSQVGR